jgi:hypothetical protein
MIVAGAARCASFTRADRVCGTDEAYGKAASSVIAPRARELIAGVNNGVVFDAADAAISSR